MTHSPRTTRRATRLAAVTGGLALAATCLLPATAASASPASAGGSSARAAAPAADGTLLSYVVNTRANAGQVQKAERIVRAAGGTVVQSWPEIGVVVAQSATKDFRQRVLADRTANGIDSVGATRTAAVTQPTDTFSGPGTTPAKMPDEGTAYDVTQTRADQAHRIDKGSADVLVAVLDSGVEDTHEDLAANFDAAASANCVQGGRLDRTAGAWRPTSSDHGTHVAGSIAADDNGKGVVGMAPDTRISSVKVVDENGFIYPEYAICGFVHAARTGADVTNNSYYIDPWQYWCPSDADQAAAIEAVRRSVTYAEREGVLSVAAAGNDYRDLANKGTDTSSPNDTTPVSRPVGACLDIPAELPGVVTVSASDVNRRKAGFSNYGLGVIDVAAPGASILSTTLGSTYGVKSGTSMASPHVAGVAALLKANNPTATPAQLLAMLKADAQDTPCHALSFAAPSTRPAQTCTGDAAYNGFFGDGIVDALDAVTP